MFYRELLGYFQELSSTYEGEPTGKFILSNNKDTTIDKKLLWKTWLERGIYFVQDLLGKDGRFLTLDKFHETFGLKVNYLQYFQIIVAIPSSLKQTALQTPISCEFLSSSPNLRPLLYPYLKCAANIITDYSMSALCRNVSNFYLR